MSAAGASCASGAARSPLPGRSARVELIGLRCWGEVREWVEGQALFFDDSFEHEVWWRSPALHEPEVTVPDDDVMQEERIVLIVDVFHPELSDLECEAIQLTIDLKRELFGTTEEELHETRR